MPHIFYVFLVTFAVVGILSPYFIHLITSVLEHFNLKEKETIQFFIWVISFQVQVYLFLLLLIFGFMIKFKGGYCTNPQM